MSDANPPLCRVRYFAGQLLTAADLQAEQDYFRARLRRHNLDLHGWGVARGLSVQVEGATVLVEPGCAIGPDGEELLVSRLLSLDLPATGGPFYLVLGRVERLADPVPVTVTGEVEYARVEESVDLTLATDEPGTNGVTLALLRRGHSGWVPDQKYRPRPLGR